VFFDGDPATLRDVVKVSVSPQRQTFPRFAQQFNQVAILATVIDVKVKLSI